RHESRDLRLATAEPCELRAPDHRRPDPLDVPDVDAAREGDGLEQDRLRLRIAAAGADAALDGEGEDRGAERRLPITERLLGQPIGLVPAYLLEADLRELCPGVTCERVEIVLLVERDRPLEVGHRELVLPDLLETSAEVPERPADLEVVAVRGRERRGSLELGDSF